MKLFRMGAILTVATSFLNCSNMTSTEGQQIAPSVPSTSAAMLRDKSAAMKIVARQVAPAYGASLDMKEASDFLVVPALLVQEAISPEIWPTYPGQ